MSAFYVSAYQYDIITYIIFIPKQTFFFAHTINKSLVNRARKHSFFKIMFFFFQSQHQTDIDIKMVHKPVVWFGRRKSNPVMTGMNCLMFALISIAKWKC